MSLSSNVNEKANLIWAIADKLTGVYKPHEYGKVILPLTVIRRFDCILTDTKEAVLKKHNSMPADFPMREQFLKKESGYEFYNTSKYTFETLLDDASNIEENFKNYINGFSENVKQIIEKFKFDNEIQTMADKNLLFIVLQEFTTPKADLHPDKISNLEMGYIFEEIIRRFSEAHNEDAGQHYTPIEVIELMVNILFTNDNDILTGNVAKTIYDPACGTGGMLSVAQDYMKKLNSSATLLPFGQEINDETFAICKADMLIKGNDANNIRNGNTLSDDNFKGEKFDYVLSNPPFGREWKNDKKAVEAEAKLKAGGRFGAGLPAVGDGQMLFLQTAIARMKEPSQGGSKIAIIHNGSPLFTGDAGSGPSNIRKYILEHDLLEAIIALPNDIFYNTGIATYIWVLSNKKESRRKGKVQLINANEMYEKRRKSLGNKRNDIPTHYIDEITQIYADFTENEVSKIFDNEDFGYSKIVVERPQKDENGKPILKSGKPIADTSLRDTENVPLKEDSVVSKNKEKDSLSEIIDKFNKKFGTEFSKLDKVMSDFKEDIMKDEQISNAGKKGDKTAFNTLYEKKFTDIAMTRYDESMKASKETDDFFKGLFENADKFKFFKELLLTEVYKELRNLD